MIKYKNKIKNKFKSYITLNWKVFEVDKHLVIKFQYV